MKGRFDPERHHRRSIRLRDHNYSQAGAYFITICTHGRATLFGEVVDGEMRLHAAGQIVREEWMRTGCMRPRCAVDAFVIMPNHMHGIIILAEAAQGTPQSASATERFGQPTSDSIPTIVRLFKAAVTKRIASECVALGTPVWQRNYFERIIRDDAALNRARQYIADNPARWAEDPENPARTQLSARG